MKKALVVYIRTVLLLCAVLLSVVACEAAPAPATSDPTGAPVNAQATINTPATATPRATATPTATANVIATNGVQTASAINSTTAAAKRQEFLEQAKKQAPAGDFFGSSFGLTFHCSLDYESALDGLHSAAHNTKFVLVTVDVHNNGAKSAVITPYDFTLVMLDGYSASVDTSTFTLAQSIKTTNLPLDGYVKGILSFVVPIESIPAQLVFNNGAEIGVTTIIER